jgi:hypothetical protein
MSGNPARDTLGPSVNDGVADPFIAELERRLSNCHGAAKTASAYVTDHAIVRYLEEVKGVDIDLIRAELLSPTATIGIAFGARSIKLKSGHRAMIEHGRIADVKPKRVRRKTR